MLIEKCIILSVSLLIDGNTLCMLLVSSTLHVLHTMPHKASPNFLVSFDFASRTPQQEQLTLSCHQMPDDSTKDLITPHVISGII